MLSLESVAADPASPLAFVRDLDIAPVRLRGWIRSVGDDVVSGPTTILLLNDGKGLHYGSPRDNTHSSANTVPNTAAHTTPDTSSNAAAAKANRKAN